MLLKNANKMIAGSFQLLCLALCFAIASLSTFPLDAAEEKTGAPPLSGQHPADKNKKSLCLTMIVKNESKNHRTVLRQRQKILPIAFPSAIPVQPIIRWKSSKTICEHTRSQEKCIIMHGKISATIAHCRRKQPSRH